MNLQTKSDTRKKLLAKVRLYRVLGNSRPEDLTDDEIHLMMALYDDVEVKSVIDETWEKYQDASRRHRATRRAR